MANDMGRTIGVSIVGLGLLALVISAPAGDRLGAEPSRSQAQADWDRAPDADLEPDAHGMGQNDGDKAADELRQSTGEPIPQPGLTADAVLHRWSDSPQKAAQKMIDKYGQPDEVTPSMLIWNQNGPFSRTIVHREAIEHNFPRKHAGVVEQQIDYRVSPDKFDDLARFNGGVVADRNAGRLSARSESEELNFLALNLAHEIATGKRSAEGARRFMARTAQLQLSGKSSPYLEGLTFKTASSSSPDRDKSLFGD